MNADGGRLKHRGPEGLWSEVWVLGLKGCALRLCASVVKMDRRLEIGVRRNKPQRHGGAEVGVLIPGSGGWALCLGALVVKGADDRRRGRRGRLETGECARCIPGGGQVVLRNIFVATRWWRREAVGTTAV